MKSRDSLAGSMYYPHTRAHARDKVADGLQNASSVLMGYLPLLLIAYAQSMAQPGIALALSIAVIGFGAVYIGSSFVAKAKGGFPVFGVVSLGGIALIGLFVLFVGAALLMSLWPVIVISAVSIVIASALVYIERTVPT